MNRAFKTIWFDKAARKARITDEELKQALVKVSQGKAVSLGGGVFKVRLNKNAHRAIILTKAGQIWLFEYLFAKNDKANIDSAELAIFKEAAKVFESHTEATIQQILNAKKWKELS